MVTRLSFVTSQVHVSVLVSSNRGFPWACFSRWGQAKPSHDTNIHFQYSLIAGDSGISGIWSSFSALIYCLVIAFLLLLLDGRMLFL